MAMRAAATAETRAHHIIDGTESQFRETGCLRSPLQTLRARGLGERSFEALRRRAQIREQVQEEGEKPVIPLWSN
eukprot:5998625-Heterocapsa_arctica.AAC.1